MWIVDCLLGDSCVYEYVCVSIRQMHEDFHNFHLRFVPEDPWATKQQVVDGSPRKRTLSMVQQDEEEKERLKEKHRYCIVFLLFLFQFLMSLLTY